MNDHIFVGQPINQTVYWSGTDTKELFLKNLNNPEKRKQLEKYNWVNTKIEYSFNSAGYRSIEFDANDNGFMVLGCSFTSGVGLHVHQIWPELLSNKLNQPVWNLGVGGTGLDTAYRLAAHYIPRLRPSKVVLLAPEKTRLEIWHCQEYPKTLNYRAHGDTEPLFNNQFMKIWLTNDANVNYYRIKNIHSIAYVCQSLGIEFYCYDVNDDFMPLQWEFSALKIDDLARDLMHNGPSCHQAFTDIVYKDITNKKTFQPDFLNVNC